MIKFWHQRTRLAALACLSRAISNVLFFLSRTSSREYNAFYLYVPSAIMIKKRFQIDRTFPCCPISRPCVLVSRLTLGFRLGRYSFYSELVGGPMSAWFAWKSPQIGRGTAFPPTDGGSVWIFISNRLNPPPLSGSPCPAGSVTATFWWESASCLGVPVFLTRLRAAPCSVFQ